jgi:hypothetical protein
LEGAIDVVGIDGACGLESCSFQLRSSALQHQQVWLAIGADDGQRKISGIYKAFAASVFD